MFSARDQIVTNLGCGGHAPTWHCCDEKQPLVILKSMGMVQKIFMDTGIWMSSFSHVMRYSSFVFFFRLFKNRKNIHIYRLCNSRRWAGFGLWDLVCQPFFYTVRNIGNAVYLFESYAVISRVVLKQSILQIWMLGNIGQDRLGYGAVTLKSQWLRDCQENDRIGASLTSCRVIPWRTPTIA